MVLERCQANSNREGLLVALATADELVQDSTTMLEDNESPPPKPKPSSQPCRARGDYDARHGREPTGEVGGDQRNKPVSRGQGLPGAAQVSRME